MKRTLILLLIIVSNHTVDVAKTRNGYPAKMTGDQKILFLVGDHPVTVEEFVYVYHKNNLNSDSVPDQKDIKAYLDLFINFKLKIAEAKTLGMDTTEAYQNELNTYIDQLKKPYLTETGVTEKLVKEAYDRYKQEVRAAHLLIKIDDSQDTLTAYNRAIELRNKIINGASFEEMAKEHSADPSAKINGGDLGYFTSFQMIYPFETAAYRTEIGQISNPVRTQYGYHLIKVKDKRPNSGKVQVAHIMIRPAGDSVVAKNKIFDVYDQAAGGAPWDELASQYSEDINSKDNGGVLRAFTTGQMPVAFQEAAFALKEEEQISDPVKTQYGWHILKLIKKEPIDTFEEMQQSIAERISKDPRSALNEKVLIKRLKKENGFSENRNRYGSLRKQADSTLAAGTWAPDIASFASERLFAVGEIAYTVSDFTEYVTSQHKTSQHAPAVFLDMLFEKYQRDKIIAYEEDHLEEKYPDYKMLLREYKEGILLFELMEDKVWNKAVEDTVGLAAFFKKNQGNYNWPLRAEAWIFSSEKPYIIADIKAGIEKGDSLFWDKEQLYSMYNSEGEFNLQVNQSLFQKGDSKILDNTDWETGLHGGRYDGKDYVVWIKALQKPRPKQLSEARGTVISDYQSALEKEWIELLKTKHPIKLNKAVLNEVYETLEKN